MDFDYDEFEKYNEYDEELEEEYEYEDDEAEGEIRVRPKKTTKKRAQLADSHVLDGFTHVCLTLAGSLEG